MKNNLLTMLLRSLAVLVFCVAWQPLYAEEEGSQGVRTPVYPGYYGVGPFSYWDRMEAQRMRALRERSEARRKARRQEQARVEDWREEAGPRLDPWADAMREQMERQSRWLRQSNEAWWRWRNPRAAYIHDVTEAKRRYFKEFAKQREKAFEQYESVPAWGAIPYW